MSHCEYDKTSSTYDTARRPLDLDDLLGRIEALAAARGVPVSDLRMLDVGAGSGNYYQEDARARVHGAVSRTPSTHRA